MLKAFKDIMILGNGGTWLVIAWLVTGMLVSLITITYFTVMTAKTLREEDVYKQIMKRLEEENEDVRERE